MLRIRHTCEFVHGCVCGCWMGGSVCGVQLVLWCGVLWCVVMWVVMCGVMLRGCGLVFGGVVCIYP